MKKNKMGKEEEDWLSITPKAPVQVVEREPRVPGHISTDMLAKAIEMQNKKLVTGSKEEVEKVLRGMTHLHLNGQGITTLGPELYGCSKLETLYLYDNRISEMPSFHRFKSLSVLNLRNNFIVQMSGLEACDRLAKLYLDGNCIQVVDGLAGCSRLEELHVSGQKLRRGMALTFDAPSMAAIGLTLTTLTAANCGLYACEELSLLTSLRRLDLTGNAFDDPESLAPVLECCPRLTDLALKDNPVTKVAKFREPLILMSDSLQKIDGLPVRPQEREFLLRLHMRRIRAQIAADRAAMAAEPPPDGLGPGPSMRQLEPHELAMLSPEEAAEAAAAGGYVMQAVDDGAAAYAGSGGGGSQPSAEGSQGSVASGSGSATSGGAGGSGPRPGRLAGRLGEFALPRAPPAKAAPSGPPRKVAVQQLELQLGGTRLK